MKRYWYWAIVVLSAAVAAAVFVTRRLWPWWLPKFSHQLWRAATYSRDRTLFGIGLALLPLVIGFICNVVRSYRQDKSNGFKEVLRNYKQSLVTGLFVWIAVVAWTFFTMPLETFTPEQIADWSYGVVVALAQNQDGDVPVASGFWVDREAHVVVCTRSLRNAPIGIARMGIYAIAPPLFNTAALSITSLGRWWDGRLDWYDDETGVAIFSVPANPFQTKPPYFSVWSGPHGPGGHLVGITTLHYDVPTFSDSQLKPGDHIFVLAVEYDINKKPILKYDDGTVERIGLEPYSGDRDQRAFTSIPFEKSYLGAPVVNANEQVVGVVGDSTDKVIVVPSQYILENIQNFTHQHR